MTVAPTSTIGYTSDPMSSGYYYNGFQTESVPELQWPFSVGVYDRMENDAKITAMLHAVLSPILRTPWRIDPAGARDEVVEHVADDLGLPIVGAGERTVKRTRDRFSWRQHLYEALTCIPQGHSVFEQEARIIDGRARLRKLGFRPQSTISEFKVASDGGLVSVTQAGFSGRDVVMPIDRLVVYTHGRKGGNWLGRSIFRAVYRDWLLKDRLLRVDTMKIERNGVGIPVYTDSGAQGSDIKAERAAGEKLAEGIRAGDNSGIGIPHDASMALLAVQGTLPDSMARLKYHDEQIASAVLGNWMNLGQGSSGGSYALGVTFVDVFDESVQEEALGVCDTANAHVVEDIVDWNWGPDEPAPRLVFDEIGSHRDLTAQGIGLLIAAGVIRPDRSLEEWVRESGGLPPKDDAPVPAPADGGTA